MTIQRKKGECGRYVWSDRPLEIGRVYVLTAGARAGQRVRPTRPIPADVGYAYDFLGEEHGRWYAANTSGICSDCGEPLAICECGIDGY